MRFAFGKNWQSFAAQIGPREVAEAKRGLLKLISANDLRGKSFLDIGCGSGLHALAAIELGAGRVTAIDIDPDSIAAARETLNVAGVRCTISQGDVFEIEGSFDVVYSWGVLHHTGDMWAAIERASMLVAPKGRFIFSLYRKTQFDAAWVFEKRLYAGAPSALQAVIRAGYLLAFRLACRRITGGSYRDFVRGYYQDRGMSHAHDVHDWLGGFPYETAAPAEVENKLASLGFRQEKAFYFPLRLRGLLGSACDEYAYVRTN